MGFLQEKESGRFFAFLVIYSLALLLTGFFLSWFHGSQARALLLEQERTVVSSLLEQGVSSEIIAASLKNETVTEEGVTLLRRVGYTETIPLWLLPKVRHRMRVFCAVVSVIGVIGGAALLSASTCFLAVRERLYRKATAIVARFADGDFKERMPGNETGALKGLFAAVDGLATALQAQTETERRAKEFLKDMISDISHQLKTPLSALAMYTEIISGEPDNATAVKEFSEKSMGALERMRELIQALLKVTRLDAGSILFDKRRYPVSEVVARATENLLTRAEMENKKIVVKGDSDETMCCDLEWTGEAIGNLVKNALDHTDSGGIIGIEWTHSPIGLRLSVSDNGEGIAQEDIYHIFKRFYRSRASGLSRSRQGVGLGLPLAKAIVEGQGGIIAVQSALGEGTVFHLTIS